MDETKIKARLLELLAELDAVSEEDKESKKAVVLDQSSVGRLSRMDAMQMKAMARETARRRSIRRAQIQAALKRLEQGDYGFCVKCEEEINEKRLDVDPAAALCVDCARSR